MKRAVTSLDKTISVTSKMFNNVDDDKLDKALYKKIKTLISKKASLIDRSAYYKSGL